MKQLLTGIVILCSMAPVFAQLQKNATTLTASASASFEFKNKQNENHPFEIRTNIQYGRFLDRKQEVGVGMGISYYKNPYDFISVNNTVDFGTSKRTGYSGYAFYRRYARLAKKLYFFSSLAAQYTYAYFNLKSTLYSSESTTHDINVGYSPGLSYFITNKLGIQGTFGQAGFNFEKTKGVDFWRSSFSLNFFPTNFNLGIFLLLNGSESDD